MENNPFMFETTNQNGLKMMCFLICMDWGASWVKEISTRNHAVFATKGEPSSIFPSSNPGTVAPWSSVP
jgi:hypothetical protein